ncbi:hypothetical protein EUTSA_v10023914mg [Eutrema salsugineum]|uniref:NB-ARC domain-containing protein n=1 Tax=Eutrema salsugineum TaxID=72664 RepID=V4ME40_EUTSA|nr:hypothetical protein EUTSA_v10023914mg [Eutrema salsugineum]
MLKSIYEIYDLPDLQVLRLLVKQIQAMEHLYLLTITLRNSTGLECFLRDKRFSSYNEGLTLGSNTISYPLRVPLATISSIRFLEIQDSDIPKIEIEGARSNESEIVGPWFPMRVDHCTGLKELTWLIFAPHLATLYLVLLPDIEHIISKDEEAVLRRTCEFGDVTPFHELEFLTLRNLGNLKSIYWDPLLFGKLKEINIKSCPGLTKLPLNSTSANQNVVIKAEEEWLKGLLWDDDATKERFLQS